MPNTLEGLRFRKVSCDAGHYEPTTKDNLLFPCRPDKVHDHDRDSLYAFVFGLWARKIVVAEIKSRTTNKVTVHSAPAALQ
jgi:hypothetical protein